MAEHQSTFAVQDIEASEEGVYVAFPESVQVIPGMTVVNSAMGEEARHLLIVNVVRPPDRHPAILLPRAGEDDFQVGDRVLVHPGRTEDGTFLLQSWDTWFLRGRGLVVSGASQGIITKGDQLVLRTEEDRNTSCRCEGIERFDDGSGKPTRPGEGRVDILIFTDCGIEREALSTGNAEFLLQEVSKYPSLHTPNNPGAGGGL